MNQLQKTILYWVGVGLAGVLAIFLLAKTNQSVDTAATTNMVSFSGEGKVLAKPDIAALSFTILTEDADSKAAQDNNSAKSARVVDFLKKQGIDEKDVRTAGYNIYPQYRYPTDNKPQVAGYQVNETLEVKLRDLTKVSSILKGVVSAGANQINSLEFKIDKPDSLRAEARAKAIADAKQKASQLKGQLGIRLGKIINFSENSTGFPPPIYYDAKAVGYGGGGPSVPTGENEITINVTVTYQIK